MKSEFIPTNSTSISLLTRVLQLKEFDNDGGTLAVRIQIIKILLNRPGTNVGASRQRAIVCVLKCRGSQRPGRRATGRLVDPANPKRIHPSDVERRVVGKERARAQERNAIHVTIALQEATSAEGRVQSVQANQHFASKGMGDEPVGSLIPLNTWTSATKSVEDCIANVAVAVVAATGSEVTEGAIISATSAIPAHRFRRMHLQWQCQSFQRQRCARCHCRQARVEPWCRRPGRIPTSHDACGDNGFDVGYYTNYYAET